jgi:MFS family permease
MIGEQSVNQQTSNPASDGQPRWPSPASAWYAAVILMLANTLAFIDRQALALLVQPIKQDLQISDTAISLLYGLSFTIFYVAVGLPVAWLADRSNRRNIVVASVAIWSLMTSLCGLARNFPMLFLARVGVGAGEGGFSPSAYSMLADYFPKERLPAAMGVYQMGVYLGGAGALLIGGLIATVIPPESLVTLPLLGAVKGWHIVFLLLGVPGLLLSLLLLTVREPARMSATGQAGAAERASLGELFRHLGRHASAYVGIGLGFALMIFVGNGTGAWIPAFLTRKFGWTTAEIGHSYGLVVFLCGTTGALTGGFVASLLRKRGHDKANLLTAVFGFVALIPITVSFPLMPTAGLSLGLIGLMNFFAGFNFGGGLAALQELTPNRMRALVSAGYLLTINLIGAALGPTAVAVVTDYWFHDPSRLPQAISVTCAIASPLSVVMLLIGLRGYSRALKTSTNA